MREIHETRATNSGQNSRGSKKSKNLLCLIHTYLILMQIISYETLKTKKVNTNKHSYSNFSSPQ